MVARRIGSKEGKLEVLDNGELDGQLMNGC